MAIPTEEEFDLAISIQFKETKRQEIDGYLPTEKSCNDFALLMYDIHIEHYERLQESVAYKWLTSQVSWKQIVRAVFKTENLRASTKEEYIPPLVKMLLLRCQPLTQTQYQRIVDERLTWQEEKHRVYEQFGHALSLNVDKNMPIPSFEEMNGQSAILARFRSQLYKIWRFPLIGTFEPEILQEYRSYFYYDLYMEDFARTGPSKTEVEFYESETTRIENAYKGLEALMPYLEKNYLFYGEQGEDGLEMKKQIDLLIHLNEIKEKIEEDFEWAHYYLNMYARKTLLIKRKDATSKERVLAFILYYILKSYSNSSRVKAIEYLLQIEGVENAPERRTIERWLQSWDKEY
jgi:hypothetical protein